MDEKEKLVQQDALSKDQERIKKLYADLYMRKHKELSESIGRTIAKTPQYKAEHKKNMLMGASGIPAGALLGLTRGKPILGGLAGGLVGVGSGHAYTRHKLKRTSNAMTQDAILKSLKREAAKNVAIHSMLAQPGKQILTVDRPWGEETYVG